MSIVTQPEVSTGHKIGKYVKYQREKREWTLHEFATRSDLTPSFLLRLEAGEYQTVKFDVIQKLAGGLEMSVRSFLWKCQLIDGEDPEEMPSVSYFLKEKYQLPIEAIEDIQLFIEFILQKYQSEVSHLREAHSAYWKDKKI